MSPHYRKSKNAHLILILNDYLHKTLDYHANKDSLRVGTPEKYGATHQFGAKKGAFGRTRHGVPIPWGDIPARPFLGLSEDDTQYILETMAEWLAGE